MESHYILSYNNAIKSNIESKVNKSDNFGKLLKPQKEGS